MQIKNPSTDPSNANNISNSDIDLYKAEINLLDAISFSTMAPNIHIHGTQYLNLNLKLYVAATASGFYATGDVRLIKSY